MRKFAHAALFIAGISAAVVAGPLLDHSITSVMGCGQTSCSVGGAGTGGDASNGAAQGSHTAGTSIVGTFSTAGTVNSGRQTLNQIGEPPETASGTFDPARGHFVNTALGPTCNGRCS
jgi:hypothetical protein